MINVTKTYLPNIEKYKEYVDRIFKNGWLTNNGEFVRKLEKELEIYLGVKHVVLVSNGTLALQIAYKALELKGEVITTPFSFVATSSSLVWEGLEPVFVDIDDKSFNMDSNKIEKAITDKTSAIVPVHVFGNSCEVDEIDKIAKKYNLKVIYDAAHAFGIKYKGESVLNYGDISTLSFHSTKIFHTIEGGALIINNDDLYEKVKKMINFGITGPEKIEVLGINAKMNEFQAAMGLCMLEEIDGIIDRRKKIVSYYNREFGGRIDTQEINKDSNSNYSYFPVVFKSEKILLQVQKKLNEKNIFPRRYFNPSLDKLPYIKSKGEFKIADNISKRILCLPISEVMTEEDVINIVSLIKTIF